MFVGKFLDMFIEARLRVIKLLGYASTARTGHLVQPFGEDCNPVLWKPVLSSTENDSQQVVVGFINPEAFDLAKGEKRIFSTDKDGKEKFYIYFKAGGTAEIGGNSDNLVRFSKLNSGFNELKDKVNDLIEKYNTHVHVSAAPGSPNAPTVTTETPTEAVISAAKIEEIKTL